MGACLTFQVGFLRGALAVPSALCNGLQPCSSPFTLHSLTSLVPVHCPQVLPTYAIVAAHPAIYSVPLKDYLPSMNPVGRSV